MRTINRNLTEMVEMVNLTLRWLRFSTFKIYFEQAVKQLKKGLIGWAVPL
jgi:hypothetical protein